MPLNPYQWLGIDPKLTHPDYFQLLGIAPDSVEQADFAERIKSAVASKKELLRQVDGKKYEQVIIQLEARIEKAAAVLADPRLRTQYIAKQRSAPSAHSQPTPHPDKPSTPSGRTNTRSSRSAPKLEDIPMAIPVRPVEPSTDEETVRQSSDESEFPSLKRFSSTKPAQVEVAESPFIQAARSHSSIGRRRNRSFLRLATAGFFLMAIAGLACVIAFFLNSNQSEVAENRNGMGDNTIPSAILTPSAPEAKEPTGTDWPNLDHSEDAIKNLQLDSLPTLTLANDDDENLLAEPDSFIQAEEYKPVESLESDSTESKQEWTRPGKKKYQQRLDELQQELSQHEFAQVTKHLRLIRSSLTRRDYALAQLRLEHFDETIEQWDTERPKAIELLRTWSETYRQFLQYVTGFQKQYMASVSKLSPAQTFFVNEIEYAFVESSVLNLTLRSGGMNLTYDRRFLPVDLAVEIAKQGKIPDLPTYRFFEAAFRIAQPNGRVEFEQEIESLISQSVRDGHNDTDLMIYLLDEDLLNNPTSQHTMTINERHVNAIQEIREKLGYDDLNSLAPDRAKQVYENLIQLETDDPVKLVAALQEAIEAAIRSLDAECVHEATHEMAMAARTNDYELKLESLSKVASRKLDPLQTMGLRRALKSLGTEHWMLTRVDKQLVSSLESRIELLYKQHLIRDDAIVSAAKK